MLSDRCLYIIALAVVVVVFFGPELYYRTGFLDACIAVLADLFQ